MKTTLKDICKAAFALFFIPLLVMFGWALFARAFGLCRISYGQAFLSSWGLFCIVRAIKVFWEA